VSSPPRDSTGVSVRHVGHPGDGNGARREAAGSASAGDDEAPIPQQAPRRVSPRSWFAVELTDDGPLPRSLVVLVAVAVVAGVALRFITRSPLWLDEALSANIAALPISEIPDALRHDGHPPLYYVVLHMWAEVVGQSDFAVRALSGLLSAATLPFAWLAGRRRGGPLLGLLTLAVFSLSPFVLRYATETRMYALVMLLVVLGYLLVDDIARRGHTGATRLIALALVAAALLWSHYWALWLLGGLGIVLLWGWRRAATPGVRRGSGRALLALVAGGVLFLPWLPTMLYQSTHTGTPWAGPMRPTAVVATAFTDFGGGLISQTYPEPELFGGVMLALLLLGLFGVAQGMRHIDLDLRTNPQLRAEGAVLAGTYLLAMAFMYASGSAFASRYASMVLPLVLLMMAGGLSRLRDLRVLGGTLGLVLVLSSLGGVQNIRIDRSQAGAVAEQMAASAQPGDHVLYCPDQVAPATMRLLPADLDHLSFPHLSADEWPADRVDWVDYRDRNSIDPRAYARAVSASRPDGALFVVFSGTYETHEGTCEELIDELVKVRGNPENLVAANGSIYYESAGLFRFGPAP
jgi:mannosyltransferase